MKTPKQFLLLFLLFLLFFLFGNINSKTLEVIINEISTNSNLVDKDKCLFHVTYDDGKTEMLEKYTLLKNLDSVKGFKCDVDKNRIIIDNNGSIKKVCSQQRNLGSIFNYKYEPKEIICNSEKKCTLYAINRITNEKKNL